MRKFIAALSFSLACSSLAGNAFPCESDMIANMQQMAENAIQCGQSAEFMSSLQAGGDGSIDFDTLSSMCNSGINVDNQLDAFNECSRINICGVLAYTYALEHLDEHGGDCQSAAAAGLEQFPVK